jgi:hypothetical protein
LYNWVNFNLFSRCLIFIVAAIASSIYIIGILSLTKHSYGSMWECFVVNINSIISCSTREATTN